MNEYTIEVSNSKRTEVVTVSHAHWMGALDKAVNGNLWATRGKVLKQNGKEFPHSETIYY
jgi:hypothetical protein